MKIAIFGSTGFLAKVLATSNEFSAPRDDRLAGSSSSRGVKWASRPYLFEVHPDEGYPSLYFSQADLLSGCLDGINSEGLTVIMLADDESSARYPGPPETTVGVGLHPLLAPRLLLDTCATVEPALLGQSGPTRAPRATDWTRTALRAAAT